MKGLSLSTQPTPTPSSDDRAAESWYLRIDGQRYGPVGRVELEEFLRPPRLCRVMEVKCGADGDWVYITKEETIDKVLVKFGVEPDPAGAAAPAQTRAPPAPRFLAGPRNFLEGLAAWLVYHWLPVFAVIALVAINAAVILMLRDPYGREREIFAQYDTLWRDARAFSPDAASEDWRKFTGPALARLEPAIKELEGSASVHYPGRQNLLFAGRDHLRKILQGEKPPDAKNPQAVLFERRLEAARAQYSAAAEGAASPPVKGTR